MITSYISAIRRENNETDSHFFKGALKLHSEMVTDCVTDLFEF